MRNLIIAVIGIIVAAACAKNEKGVQVPASVSESFTKLFPGASDVEWSRESESEFEAEFKMGKIEKSSVFDASGKWISTETVIDKDELPAAIKEALEKEFSGARIEGAEIVESAEGVTYEAEIESGETDFEVLLTADGQILKKEKIGEEEEEKD